MATQVSGAATVAVAVVITGLLLPLVSTFPQLDREPEFPPDSEEDDISPRFLTRGWPGNDLPPGRLPPGGLFPGRLPPGELPRGRLPPGGLPPGGLPPGGLPPGGLPPGEWGRPFFPTTTRRPSRRQQQNQSPDAERPPTPPQELDFRPRRPQGGRRPPGSTTPSSEGVRRTTRPPTLTDSVRRTTIRPTTPSDGVRRTTRPPTVTEGTQRTTSRPTTVTAGTTSQDCNCPVTNEFNPVCGSDGVSYPNPGRLRCAKDCGKRVSVYHIGNCVSTSTSPPSSVSSRLRP